MKSPSQIFGSLATSILYPHGWPPFETGWFWIGLFLIVRIAMAIGMIPMVMISGMASDSGTEVAINAAVVLMYAMSLLLFAALFWSWRCVVVSIGIMVSIFIILPTFSKNSPRQVWMSRILPVLCFVATEAFLAPLQTILYFVLWCFSNDGDSTTTAEFVPIKNEHNEML